MKNLFKNIPDKLPKELFETLVENEHIQIERIVSRGHASPEEDWYDQDRDETTLHRVSRRAVRVIADPETPWRHVRRRVIEPGNRGRPRVLPLSFKEMP